MKLRKNQGFSLIELMIVVGIIGILAALAIPRFSTFQAKARQSEAKTSLTSLYTLQQTYFNDQNTYLALAAYGKSAGAAGCDCPANGLGFRVTPCTAGTNNALCPRYGYSTTTATATAFVGLAQTGTSTNNLVVPGCATADSWTINESKFLTSPTDAVSVCP